jgi:hypothetical protein
MPVSCEAANPAAGKCSIEAAISRGLVQRHEEAGHPYLPLFGKLRLAYVAAIALGLVDQAAVDIIVWELRTFAAVMPRFGIAIGAI